jgi:hypothetical protein
MSRWKDHEKFAQLSDAEKIEARISWLEQKMVEVLWFVIQLSSLIFGAIAAFVVRNTLDTESIWLYGPPAVVAWIMSAWLVRRKAFRDAPPRIGFLDP